MTLQDTMSSIIDSEKVSIFSNNIIDNILPLSQEGEPMSTFIQMQEGPDGLKERLAEIGINLLLKMVSGFHQLSIYLV